MFFALSKILWFLLAPFNVALFALTGAMLAMRARLFRTARILGVAAWGVLIVFGVLPTGPLLTEWLQTRHPAPAALPGPVHGIIVLGGAIDTEQGQTHGRPQYNAAADRIATFAELGRRHQWAKLVYTSGLGTLDGKGTPEGQMARAALAEFGFNPGRRLIVEDASRTTFENAALSKELAKPQPGQNWLLVTSGWHMPRALGAFRAADWAVIPYPTDYVSPRGRGFLGNMEASHTALKELLGIAAYAATGKWKAQDAQTEEPS